MKNIKEVEFLEEEHKYYYRGIELKGVTTAINAYMGKFYPSKDGKTPLKVDLKTGKRKRVCRLCRAGVSF